MRFRDFQGKKATERETEQRIMYMEPDFPKNMDADAADFIKKSISKVALRRPSAAELLNHKWVTRYTKAPRESAKPPVGSSHQGIVVDAGTPHESLRPQLSMMNVKVLPLRS